MENKQMPQNIILENRKKADISGVCEVKSFDDEEVVLFVSSGRLTIKGSELHINRLSIETGEAQIQGNVDSLVYSNKTTAKGFLSGLFK